MKTIHGILTSLLLLCLLLGGCSSEEDEKYETIDIEISGTEWSNVNDGYTVDIKAPAEGVKFSVTPTGKNANMGYAKFIYTRDDMFTINEAFSKNLVPFSLDGVLDITYDSDKAPAKMWITIEPNTTGSERLVTVSLGEANIYKKINIYQK